MKGFGIERIKKLLPHRFPFLMVDKIVDVELNKRIVAVKNVTVNEEFFNGHFPNRPVMPGVMILESMAQAAGLAMLAADDAGETPATTLFTGVDNAKFRRPVVPGDQIVIEVEIISHRGRAAKAHGVARVEGNVVAEADMMFVLAQE